MLVISSTEALTRALETPIDPNLKALLTQRRDQLGSEFNLSEMARFVIVQAGDDMDALAAELGFSPFINAVDHARFGDPGFTPSWEWILDHGFCFELVFVFSDSGFGEVLFVDKAAGQDARLLALCEAHRNFSSADF